MTVVIRFVDKPGFTRERFLDIVHVSDTSSTTLKEKLSSVLAQHGLVVNNIRGQGYDGASNMRGEWNGLQAKFMEECPYAYYIHYFAHQLQLALVAASKEVADVHTFFDHLALVVNMVVSSSKRNDELQVNQVTEMEHLIELSELETRSGANQVGTLQRPCDTRWSSHYASICSLLKLYKPTFLVLKSIATAKGSGTSPSARAKAYGAVKLMMSFDFIFGLHVMKELMGITDLLCKKLQQKSQDIVNAMDDVKTTKVLIQELRDNGWNKLKADMLSFCGKHGVPTPHFDDLYVDFINSRADDETTVEHHYRCDVFMVVVDQQAQELNCRFNKQATKLLILCTSLDPSNSFRSFNIDNICSLASKFYAADFEEQERNNLRCQLRHYENVVPTNPKFQNLTSISELCQQLAATRKSDEYHLIDRLIRLVLTLSVSTATTERAFSAMKLVKTRLRTKMEDGFLRDCLVIYIEKEIAAGISTNAIIDEFDESSRRVPFT
ncbi:zinc finger MYM-type protein 1 [Triticum aestivum]|uniref:zinc finger MYM-type protein 1 n=1 Tax=Triticum aestivum TaxID=4565 RepID=UPI0008436C7A|nr:zinc finger MYM-type protein 1-like [Triticum aestivum]